MNSSRALASSHSVGGSVSLAMVAINKNVMHLAQNLSTPDLCCSFCIKGIFIHKYSPLIVLHDSYRVNRSKALATKSGQECKICTVSVAFNTVNIVKHDVHTF